MVGHWTVLGQEPQDKEAIFTAGRPRKPDDLPAIAIEFGHPTVQLIGQSCLF